MTFDQILLFALIAAILGMLLWGRFRHDLVAAGGLLIAVALGLVPEGDTFSGLSNPAVIIVALALIASRAFENSGALSLLARPLIKEERATTTHTLLTAGVGAFLSAIINNVAALALLMPVDVRAARKAGRPPGMTLMPLSFATILGGMITLIGTPPNIIAASIRAEKLGAPYSMFDFTPVGLVVASAGLLFVALVGWRLVPRREDKATPFTDIASFKAELIVPEDSPIIGRLGAEIEDDTEKADVLLIGLIREGRHFVSRARALTIRANDVLVIEGATDGIADFIKAAGLQEAQEEATAEAVPSKSSDESAESEGEPKEQRAKPPEIVEAVVRSDSRLIGRTAKGLALRNRFGVTLLGIARAGTVTRRQVHERAIQAGDVLLLAGRGAEVAATLDLLGGIPISRVSIAPVKPFDIALALGLFVGAIGLATAGILSFDVALAIAVAGYAAFGLVPAREFYQQIEWSVVVMLACLLPIASAFETLGGTALTANAIVSLTQGEAPLIALIALMVVTMTMSDTLNNVATMVIMGPVGVDLARTLSVNPDTFLMGTAIAASCAFLTPIGHKNNTLIMGPGGFRFGDYWRLGLPLEIIVLTVAIPMLLIVWPLSS